jgi:hypothetical protein
LIAESGKVGVWQVSSAHLQLQRTGFDALAQGFFFAVLPDVFAVCGDCYKWHDDTHGG